MRPSGAFRSCTWRNSDRWTCCRAVYNFQRFLSLSRPVMTGANCKFIRVVYPLPHRTGGFFFFPLLIDLLTLFMWVNRSQTNKTFVYCWWLPSDCKEFYWTFHWLIGNLRLEKLPWWVCRNLLTVKWELWVLREFGLVLIENIEGTWD